MKKVFLLTAIVLISASVTKAQTVNTVHPANNSTQEMHPKNPTLEQRAQMLTDKENKLLNLSAQQKTQMYQVNLSLTKRIVAARQGNSTENMHQILLDRAAQYKKILTAEQYQKTGLEKLQYSQKKEEPKKMIK